MTGDDCFEVVKDVLINGIVYADLFIMTDRLVYVPLAVVEEPQGGGLAELAGSVGLVDKQGQARASARGVAAHFRKRFEGLSIEARIGLSRNARKGGGPLILMRGDTRGFRLRAGPESAGLIEIAVADGKPLVALVAGAAQLCERLHLWLSGKPVRVSCDLQGLDVSLPDHTRLLAWIENPAKIPEITVEDCVRAANTLNYCQELARQIKKRPWLQREQLCELVKDRSVPLAGGLGAAIAARPLLGLSEDEGSGPTVLTAVFAFLTALASIFGVGLWAGSAENSASHVAGGWLLAGAAVLGVTALVELRLALRDRRRNKELAVKLCK